MALQEYEVVNKRIDKSKSWINTKYKQIISREIRGYTYYCVVKKLDTDGYYSYYVILGTDEFASNRDYHRIYYDDYGRAKINVSDIVRNLLYDTTKDTQINLSLVETESNYAVYRIDV